MKSIPWTANLSKIFQESLLSRFTWLLYRTEQPSKTLATVAETKNVCERVASGTQAPEHACSFCLGSFNLTPAAAENGRN
jgi:hypothetical protein